MLQEMSDSMTETSRTIVEWTYKPIRFFEEPLEIEFQGGQIHIAEGTARGSFEGRYYSEGRTFCDAADEFLRSVFLAHQIQVHEPATLTQPSMAREHSDGRRDVTVFPDPAVLTISVSSPDIRHVAADGTVLADTRADRLDRHASFRTAVANLLPLDPELKRMMQSYNNALTDRDNLLIHLHEVRETICGEIGGERKACEQVGVSRSEWRRFGRLANDEPLLEGRHRGKHSELRKASREESDWALEFCQRLIEGYVLAQP